MISIRPYLSLLLLLVFFSSAPAQNAYLKPLPGLQQVAHNAQNQALALRYFGTGDFWLHKLGPQGALLDSIRLNLPPYSEVQQYRFQVSTGKLLASIANRPLQGPGTAKALSYLFRDDGTLAWQDSLKLLFHQAHWTAPDAFIAAGSVDTNRQAPVPWEQLTSEHLFRADTSGHLQARVSLLPHLSNGGDTLYPQALTRPHDGKVYLAATSALNPLTRIWKVNLSNLAFIDSLDLPFGLSFLALENGHLLAGTGPQVQAFTPQFRPRWSFPIDSLILPGWNADSTGLAIQDIEYAPQRQAYSLIFSGSAYQSSYPCPQSRRGVGGWAQLDTTGHKLSQHTFTLDSCSAALSLQDLALIPGDTALYISLRATQRGLPGNTASEFLLKTGAQDAAPGTGLRWLKIAVEEEYSPDGPGLRLYPNPNKTQTFFIRSDAHGVCRFALYDLTGRLIIDKPVLLDGSNLRTIKINAPPGTYFYHINNRNKLNEIGKITLK